MHARALLLDNKHGVTVKFGLQISTSVPVNRVKMMPLVSTLSTVTDVSVWLGTQEYCVRPVSQVSECQPVSVSVCI